MNAATGGAEFCASVILAIRHAGDREEVRRNMAINYATIEMNQLLKSMATRLASINSNWDKIPGGGDLAEHLAALEKEALALNADLGNLLVVVGNLATALRTRSTSA
jgi:hypothetical protein